MQPYFYAGHGIGYLALSKLKVKTKADGEYYAESADFNGSRKFNAKINIGGEIKFWEISAELRYQ
ncbi:hypothetical protein [Saccharicrinis sp. GN24d3]|uniref:hypothetical protein n=1 Tax=Saccharicrinis sp. GN24d3 TaxID=3458416 RepID=UPI004035AF9C